MGWDLGRFGVRFGLDFRDFGFGEDGLIGVFGRLGFRWFWELIGVLVGWM